MSKFFSFSFSLSNCLFLSLIKNNTYKQMWRVHHPTQLLIGSSPIFTPIKSISQLATLRTRKKGLHKKSYSSYSFCSTFFKFCTNTHNWITKGLYKPNFWLSPSITPKKNSTIFKIFKGRFFNEFLILGRLKKFGRQI